MRKLLILMAGGVLGYFTKTVIDVMKGPLIVNTTTGQQGQRVPPSNLKGMDEAGSAIAGFERQTSSRT